MAHLLLHTSRDVWNVNLVAPVETFPCPNKELKGFIKESCSEWKGGRKKENLQIFDSSSKKCRGNKSLKSCRKRLNKF